MTTPRSPSSAARRQTRLTGNPWYYKLRNSSAGSAAPNWWEWQEDLCPPGRSGAVACGDDRSLLAHTSGELSSRLLPAWKPEGRYGWPVEVMSLSRGQIL